MQAQDGAEGKEAEEGGQYAAPPAGAKAGSLVIGKESMEFLLEHGGC